MIHECRRTDSKFRFVSGATRYSRWLVKSMVLFAGMILLQNSCRAEDDPRIKKIVGDWNARQTRLKSLRATWTETSTSKKLKAQQVMTLRLGDHMRTRVESRPPIRPEEELNGIEGRKGVTISAFDGARNWEFRNSIEEDHWDTGKFWSDKKNDHLQDFQLSVWFLYCRAVQVPVQDLVTKHLKLVAQNEIVDGHRCTVIENVWPGSTIVGTYWIDLERDSVILKKVDKVNGIVALELNVKFKPEPTLGWIPESWNGKFSRGRDSINGQLLTYEINPEVKASDFEIKFPPGTIVFEQDRGQRYLCLEDGKKRIITPEESANGFNYFDLFPKNEGTAVPKK